MSCVLFCSFHHLSDIETCKRATAFKVSRSWLVVTIYSRASNAYEFLILMHVCQYSPYRTVVLYKQCEIQITDGSI